MLRMEHDYKRVPQRPRVKPKSINTDPSALNCVWLHLMMKYICSYWLVDPWRLETAPNPGAGALYTGIGLAI